MDSQAADAASAAQQLKFSKVTTIFSQQNSELEHLFSEVTKNTWSLELSFFYRDKCSLTLYHIYLDFYDRFF